ncbi:hypothetical protein GGR52DRAFT_139356 [Hypoxylon sp. FL1284]|nr:hypothetical protein GGR52DRAFT_139356 [Hypoxylon sp. FL1284]
MSVQTFVLENGEWVARTVSTFELMNQKISEEPKTPTSAQPRPPFHAVLTRTVVDSPIIRWVLPVQLRSARRNDVALISDHSVQICELGHDRQLKDIVKKNDFGSRIRNAVVMGSPQYSRKASEPAEDSGHVKTEDLEHPLLPPQLLILALERGVLVFLFLQKDGAGNWTWVSSTHKVPGKRLVYPGFHMAIDPSSTFLVLACPEDIFVVYRLEQMSVLEAKRSEPRPSFAPITGKVSRNVEGIIHKIEFLHPTQGHTSQVILLIILVQPEVSRLAVLEWNSWIGLKQTLKKDIKGYRLDEEYRMPLLVVPLKVRNAFLVVTERITATCSDILAGPPVFIQFGLASRDSTELHLGTREPLWTAWTRPIRHPPYHAKKDVIYLAREDGLINLLECGDESEIETSVSMGSVDCNIDTAFASLFHLFADVLVTGGDSGPGAVWNVEARQSLQRIGSIANWSPTVDFAMTNDLMNGTPRKQSANPGAVAPSSSGGEVPLRPDKVFACSGRGITGAIVEFRYGVQARIGLDLTYSSNIRHCWAVSNLGGSDDGFYLLLALLDGSTVLHLSSDLSEASEKDNDTVPYDLSSTTLAAQETSGAIVQVTVNYITIVTPSGYYQNLISDVIKDYVAVVADAAVWQDTVALAVHSGSTFKIVLLRIRDFQISLQHVFDVQGEVTCLAIQTYCGILFVVAGLQQGDDEPTLALYPTQPEHQCVAPNILKSDKDLIPPAFTAGIPVDKTSLGALTSIVCAREEVSGSQVVAMGTKNGYLVTTSIDNARPGDLCLKQHRFGASPCYVFSGEGVEGSDAVLVCCDAELAILRTAGIQRVWPTDGDRPSMPCPPINSVAPLHRQLLEYGKSTTILIAGPRIMITDLEHRPKPVPRYFPVGGSPVNIMYSSRLEALVTVVSKDGLPSLHFLDPVTGCDLSQPLGRRRVNGSYEYSDVDYIAGLGNADTRAVCMATWTYRYAGISGNWIVLALRRKQDESLLLIISAESENIPSQTGMSRRIRFWTKFDRKIRAGPISAVATDESGVFLCVGQDVQYHIIEDNKFKVLSRHELPSPASCMRVVDKRLHAFTTKHSLVVLDYKRHDELGYKEMARLHTDAISRNGLHSIEVGSPPRAITVLSDPMCGIHGLWAPPDPRFPLRLIFQAELQASVRRFARGFTRPPWVSDTYEPRFGCIDSGLAGSDILGLAIDGSIQHFSFLDQRAWRLLRFIQNMALVSSIIYTHPAAADSSDEEDQQNHYHEVDWYEPPYDDSGLKRQVDGDVLQRCLDRRALEKLFSKPLAMDRLRELLDEMDKEDVLLYLGEAPFQDDSYFELAYCILSYYLSPVL